MSKRYSLVCRGLRGGIFYCYDATTKKRDSLKTKDPAEAEPLVAARNEANSHAAMNLQIAQVYLRHSDPALASRTWADVMTSLASMKKGPTRDRYDMAIQDSALELIRSKKLLETRSEDFLSVLQAGTVSTNVYLRRFHNFALGMQWLPWPVLPRLQWPSAQYKDKRVAIGRTGVAVGVRQSAAVFFDEDKGHRLFGEDDFHG